VRFILLALALCAAPFALWLQGRTPIDGARSELFTRATLQERVEDLRPLVERALGEPFPGPVDVRPVAPSQLAAILREEMPVILDLDAMGIPPMVNEAFAKMVFAKVGIANARLLVCPAGFRHLDALTGGRFELVTERFRDIVLVHELVHVHQFRSLDGAAYYGLNPGIPELHGPASVIEGHAQFVAERVARARGLEEEYLRLTGLATGDMPGLSEESRAMVRTMASVQAFPYYRGTQLVDRVVRQRGYEKAVAALFEDAPDGVGDVTLPQDYLPPDEAALRYERAAQRVERYLGELFGAGAKLRDPWRRNRWRDDGLTDGEMSEKAERLYGDEGFTHSIACSVDLRLEWDDLSVGEVAAKSRGLIAGDRFTAPERAGEVTLWRFEDAESASAFPSVLMERLRAKPGIWKPGEREGRDAARFEENTGRPFEGYVVSRDGTVVVEVRAELFKDRDRDLAWARAVSELVRSAYEPAPWRGVAYEDVAPVFLEALDAPHWGLRWRAVRNLGRLRPETEGVFDGVVRALGDEDALVRLAALHAVLLWDRAGDVPQEVRERFDADPDADVRRLAGRMWR